MVEFYTLYPGEGPNLVSGCNNTDTKTITQMHQAQELNMKLETPMYSWVVYRNKIN